jgi:hypothetical protein
MLVEERAVMRAERTTLRHLRPSQPAHPARTAPARATSSSSRFASIWWVPGRKAQIAATLNASGDAFEAIVDGRDFYTAQGIILERHRRLTSRLGIIRRHSRATGRREVE